MFSENKLFFLFIFLGVFFDAFAQTPSAAERLSTTLQNLQTFQANFSQVIEDKNGRILSQSQGKMALKRPGLFRWETLQPNQQLMIADGKTLWIYDKDLAQVSRQKQNAVGNAPGLLLSAPTSRLVSQFKIIFNEGDNNTFKLTPRAQKDLFEFIILKFDAQFKLQQMLLQDHLGQITQIIFNQSTVNQPVSNELFRFHVPSGVQVVAN